MLRFLKYKFNRYSLAHEYLMHFLVLFFTFAFFFLTDFLMKWFLFEFDHSKQGIGVSFWLFGIRSYPHANTTLISFLKFKANPLFLGIFAVTIFTILLLSTLKIKRKLYVFWMMIIGAGILGNGLDFLRFNYVQDIIYLPWYDRGTFNIADVWIIIGAGGLALSILINEVIRESQSESII